MASGSQELDVFVRDALLRGHSRAQVQQILLQAGWGAGQVQQALDNYAPLDFPVPIPRPRASLSAREAFLYLVSFSALYFFCYHLGSLWFSLIEHWLPDPADARWRIVRLGPEIRWSVSALLIAFPVFAFTARLLVREMATNTLHRLSPIRRWLTYFTLFIAACVLIGDTTVLVHTLLGGELTLRFMLKATVIAVIAGTVFAHYLRDLRQEERAPDVDEGPTRALASGGRLLAVAGAITAAALAYGMWVMGSPLQQRLIRLDANRIAHLEQIERAATRYHDDHGALPPSLQTLADLPGATLTWHDPRSGEAYGYRVVDATGFELCAHFDTHSAQASHPDEDWPHPAGAHCFIRHLPKPAAAQVQ